MKIFTLDAKDCKAVETGWVREEPLHINLDHVVTIEPVHLYDDWIGRVELVNGSRYYLRRHAFEQLLQAAKSK